LCKRSEKLEGKYSLESTDPRESEIRALPQPLPYLMPIPTKTLFYNKKIYHSLFVARTWQHFIDLLKRKNPQFTVLGSQPACDMSHKPGG